MQAKYTAGQQVGSIVLNGSKAHNELGFKVRQKFSSSFPPFSVSLFKPFIDWISHQCILILLISPSLHFCPLPLQPSPTKPRKFESITKKERKEGKKKR